MPADPPQGLSLFVSCSRGLDCVAKSKLCVGRSSVCAACMMCHTVGAIGSANTCRRDAHFDGCARATLGQTGDRKV